MDFGFDPQPQLPPKTWMSAIWETTFCLVIFSGIVFLCGSAYLMGNRIEELEASSKRVSHEQHQQAQKLAELNKNYSNALEKLQQDFDQALAQLSAEFDKKCSQDPVGRPDMALQPTGGKVLSFVGENYPPEKWFCVFSPCSKEQAHGPSALIQATTSPGECWAFKGQQASAVIQLIGAVKVDAVTLENIPLTLSPTGNMDSAPKNFKVWGLSEPQAKGENKFFLGKFEYNKEDGRFQTFQIENTNYYKYIEFQVLSNHGSDEFTCVYRLRVHGKLKK